MALSSEEKNCNENSVLENEVHLSSFSTTRTYSRHENSIISNLLYPHNFLAFSSEPEFATSYLTKT